MLLAETAWLLAEAFGTSPQFWGNLQSNYDTSPQFWVNLQSNCDLATNKPQRHVQKIKRVS